MLKQLEMLLNTNDDTSLSHKIEGNLGQKELLNRTHKPPFSQTAEAQKFFFGAQPGEVKFSDANELRSINFMSMDKLPTQPAK